MLKLKKITVAIKTNIAESLLLAGQHLFGRIHLKLSFKEEKKINLDSNKTEAIIKRCSTK